MEGGMSLLTELLNNRKNLSSDPSVRGHLQGCWGRSLQQLLCCIRRTCGVDQHMLRLLCDLCDLVLAVLSVLCSVVSVATWMQM